MNHLLYLCYHICVCCQLQLKYISYEPTPTQYGAVGVIISFLILSSYSYPDFSRLKPSQCGAQEYKGTFQ